MKALPPKIWLPQKPAISRAHCRPVPSCRLVSKAYQDASGRGWQWVAGAGFVPFWAGQSAVLSATVATRTHTADPASQSNAGSATATFNSVACGTADGTSLVAVIASCVKNGAANIAFNSGAIDGTNGTIHANITGNINLGTGSVAAVYSRATTNTSITITSVYSITNWLGCMITVYRLNNLTSATPHATATASNAAGAGFSTTINIPDVGILLQGVTIYSLAGSPTVTGATEDRATTYNSAGRGWAGSDDEMASETNRSLTSTNGTTTGALAAASWA